MRQDWIALHAEPIEVGPAAAFVSAPGAGGIDVFIGTTRAEAGAEGRRLVALDYEAYATMALKQMQELATRARERWPSLTRIAMLHRTGRVEVGQPSVIVAVSAPHRDDAFVACRWLIDTLKAEVPIWKREVWDDGSGTWVDPGAGTGGKTSE
jgi:molybdopterin synthase catalytic subunit